MHLLPGQLEDPISCYLSRVSLDSYNPVQRSNRDHPPQVDPDCERRCRCKSSCQCFEALSYCWGSSTESRSISVDGVEGFRVTDNLFAALRRLRRLGEERTLWIDHVCINQSDDLERSHQVAWIGRVYSTAATVVIWLGDIEEADIMSAERYKYLPKSFRHLDGDCFKGGLDPMRLATIQAAAEDPQTRALASVTCDSSPSWWTRTWVLQEFAMAEVLPIVQYGSFEISWQRFGYILDDLQISPWKPAGCRDAYRRLSG